MALYRVTQVAQNTGAATPATPGSLTTTAGNTLLYVVVVVGSGTLTVATPASWTPLFSQILSTFALVAFVYPNCPGGASNPSSTLGGTITAWSAAQYEVFVPNGGAVINVANSNQATSQAIAALAPSTRPQSNPASFFFYVAAGAGLFNTVSLTGLNPLDPSGAILGGSSWMNNHASLNQGAGSARYVSFFGQNAGCGVGPMPTGSALMAGSYANASGIAQFWGGGAVSSLSGVGSSPRAVIQSPTLNCVTGG